MQAFKGDNKAWNTLLLTFPNAHLLQTWEWGESKIRNGWIPSHYVWINQSGESVACALVLQRELKIGPIKLCVLYCPKGPSLDWSNETLRERVMGDLETLSKKKKAIFLKIDPDLLVGTGIPGSETAISDPFGQSIEQELLHRKWVFSQDQIQFRNTVFIDLRDTEENIISAMKQKTRYNIRLAQRRGVMVRQAALADLPMLYQIYAKTAVRDDFVIRGEDYYHNLWGNFMRAGMAHALIAEVEGETVAGLFLLHFNKTARYMFGMSTEKYRELMPNYLLQWEAIRLSKQLGYEIYDMWGAPDVFDESDPLWGVYRFKEGFNGTTVRHIGAWDYSSRPLLYKLYTKLLPRLLDIMRRRGKRATKNTLNQ